MAERAETKAEFLERVKRQNDEGLRRLASLGLFALNHDVMPETRETEELMPVNVVLLDHKTMQPLSQKEKLRWFYENGGKWT